MAPTQTPARDAVLVKYLNEAFGKEKQLETNLTALIGRAQNHKTLKKGLKDHLKVTKNQSRELQKRIRALGGKAEAGAKPGGPGAVTGAPVEAGTMLRDVRDALWQKGDEVAHYHVIHTVAERLRDRETASLAKRFRREEERMQSFLGRQIKTLVGEVVKEEVPASERRSSKGGTRRRASARATSSGRAAAKPAAKPATKSAPKPARKTATKPAGTKRKPARTTAKKTTRATRSTAKRATK